MKKICALALMLVLTLACCAYSETKAGILSKANSSEEEYQVAFSNEDIHNALITAEVFSDGVKASGLRVRFYDSFMAMQLALNRGEVDVILAPAFSGEYMLRNNPEYVLRGVMIGTTPIALSFGFMEEKADLQRRFNEALAEMNNGALALLVRDYITLTYKEPPVITFDKFDDAETINVAVTGDLPPIDYIAADGTPAGFNTALLAEIGRRLHVNINLVNIETGARMSALKSGRVDAIFWIEVLGAIKDGHEVHQSDITEGVIYSKPYYGWNQVFLIGKK